MRIIHVVNFFLPDRLAGIENYVFQLTKKLKNAGHEIYIIRPDYWNSESYVIEEIPVIYYKEEGVASRAMVQGFEPSLGVMAFKKLLERLKPDIAHFHELNKSNGISVFHLEAAKSLKIKIVLTFHMATPICLTGNLMYKKHEPCDGKIDQLKCATCVINSKVKISFIERLLSFLNVKFIYIKLSLIGREFCIDILGCHH